jgi:hypothetical protein
VSFPTKDKRKDDGDVKRNEEAKKEKKIRTEQCRLRFFKRRHLERGWSIPREKSTTFLGHKFSSEQDG